MLKIRGSYSDGAKTCLWMDVVIFNRARPVVPGSQSQVSRIEDTDELGSVIPCPRTSTQPSKFTGGNFEVGIAVVIVLPKSEILYSHFAASH